MKRIKMPFHFKAVSSFVACKLTGKLIKDVSKAVAQPRALVATSFGVASNNDNKL